MAEPLVEREGLDFEANYPLVGTQQLKLLYSDNTVH